ncbi:DUF4476 domain-containing protein [Flavitalea flava]
MLKCGLIALLVLMAGRNYGQEYYFVLIQADNNQPFYVHMEDKTYSSSIQGRLILPQLKEGLNSILIGFPKKRFPDQQFSLFIPKKDLELQLKDLGEKGWGLFNTQTLELKMPDAKDTSATKAQIAGVKKDDAFSRLMAGVVSDTAVMYNTYATDGTLKESSAGVKAVSPGKPDVFPVIPSPDSSKSAGITETGKTSPGIIPVPDTGSLALNPNNAGTGVSKKEDLIKEDSLKGSPGKTDSLKTVSFVPDSPMPFHSTGVILKLSERKTAKAIRLVYLDHVKGKKADTIIMIIPFDSVEKKQLVKSQPNTINNGPVSDQVAQSEQTPASTVALTSSPTPSVTSTNIAHSSADEGPAGLPVSSAAASPEPLFRSRTDSAHKKQANKILLVNSDCRNFASDYDVDKLRVKMLEAGKDDDRILTAKKVFRTKCFTTKQIKALSEVFTSDQLKFRFFESAYPFVSDNHFRELSDLLADPVYYNKFKTMTGQE